MKYLLTFLLIAGTGIFSFGQQQLTDAAKLDIFGNPQDPENQMYIRMMNYSNGLLNEADVILYPDWKQMEATGLNDAKITVDSANYNFGTGQFFFVHQFNLYHLPHEKVRTVQLGTDHFAVYPYIEDKKKKSGFFQVLVDGDFPLLKRIYLKEVVTNDHPMKLPQANRLEYKKTTDLYYFDEKDQRAEELPGNKRKFINLFRKRQAKLIRFAEENKISTRKEEDVIRFFRYNKVINSEENQ